MQHIKSIPKEIKDMVGNEEIEFATRGGRRTSTKGALIKSLAVVAGIATVIRYAAPLFIDIYERGSRVASSANALETDLFWYWFLGIMVVGAMILALFVAIRGIIEATKNFVALGDWYIGTPSQLIIFGKKEISAIGWKEFKPDVKIDQKGEQGTITLYRVKGDNFDKHFGYRIKPSITKIVYVNNFNEIGKICRENIIKQGIK